MFFFFFFCKALNNCYTLNENIIYPSTIMDIINTFENVFDSVVYGIDNPINKKEHITMCSIIVDDDFNVQHFTDELTKLLNPTNGLPVFIKVFFGNEIKNSYKTLKNDNIEDYYKQVILERKNNFQLYWLIEKVINKTINSSVSITKSYEYTQFRGIDFNDVLSIKLKPKL